MRRLSWGAVLVLFVMMAGHASAAEKCFRFKTKTTEAFLRLDLPEGNGKVTGSETGTVQDDEQGYYTSWESTLSGKRKGNRLTVSVETRIEDDLQKDKKTYEIGKDGVITAGKDRYEPLDCAKAQPAQ